MALSVVCAMALGARAVAAQDTTSHAVNSFDEFAPKLAKTHRFQQYAARSTCSLAPFASIAVTS